MRRFLKYYLVAVLIMLIILVYLGILNWYTDFNNCVDRGFDFWLCTGF